MSSSGASRLVSALAFSVGVLLPIGVYAPAASLAATFDTLPAGISGGWESPSDAVPITRARPLLVTGLGDSIESGYNCGCTSYVVTAGTKYAARLGHGATIANQAVAGAMTDDVLAQLSYPTTRSRVTASALTIIEIGANDFNSNGDSLYRADCLPVREKGCYTATMNRMVANLTEIVEQVQALQAENPGRVVLLGYWNVFPDGAVGRSLGATYMTSTDQLTRWVNESIEKIALDHQVVYADAYTPFKGGGTLDPSPFLASDGEHPNATGHGLLAKSTLTSLGVS